VTTAATAARGAPGQPKGGILVTGTRFVEASHIAQLRAAGFRVTRLRSPEDKQALTRAVAGKRGYIWGGMELIDADVMRAGENLEAIAFPGSGYTEFIPTWEEATARGIAISTARGANAPGVAEYAITLMLTMIRGLPVTLDRSMAPEMQRSYLRRYPPRELGGLTLGVVGLGETGRLMAMRAHALGMKILAARRRAGPVDAPDYIETVSLPQLLRRADAVSLHVDAVHGRHVLGATQLRRMKRGALLINVAFPDAVDCRALKAELRRGRLRAAFDAPPEISLARVGPGIFVASTSQFAFDTVESNRRVGDRVTQAMIAMLRGQDDPGIVNPDYNVGRANKPGGAECATFGN
jgi:phosphoglycerate dehydrogenase-like enzyme